MSTKPAAKLEKALEEFGAREAKRRGIFVLKLKRIAGPGWPDHTMIYRGRVGFIEYKRDEKSKFQPLQEYYLKLLQKCGCVAQACWNKEQVIQAIEDFVAQAEA